VTEQEALLTQRAQSIRRA